MQCHSSLSFLIAVQQSIFVNFRQTQKLLVDKNFLHWGKAPMFCSPFDEMRKSRLWQTMFYHITHPYFVLSFFSFSFCLIEHKSRTEVWRVTYVKGTERCHKTNCHPWVYKNQRKWWVMCDVIYADLVTTFCCDSFLLNHRTCVNRTILAAWCQWRGIISIRMHPFSPTMSSVRILHQNYNRPFMGGSGMGP